MERTAHRAQGVSKGEALYGQDQNLHQRAGSTKLDLQVPWTTILRFLFLDGKSNHSSRMVGVSVADNLSPLVLKS